MNTDRLKKYGYTEDNLYTSENRVKKVARKVLHQTLLYPKYSYPESDIVTDAPVYITKELADKLPEELYIKITYDDFRKAYTTEEAALAEREPVLVSSGPGYDDIDIPHLIFEEEIKHPEPR